MEKDKEYRILKVLLIIAIAFFGLLFFFRLAVYNEKGLKL